MPASVRGEVGEKESCVDQVPVRCVCLRRNSVGQVGQLRLYGPPFRQRRFWEREKSIFVGVSLGFC